MLIREDQIVTYYPKNNNLNIKSKIIHCRKMAPETVLSIYYTIYYFTVVVG